MEFNSKSVVFFKPQKAPVNILVASKYSPLMSYFSIENITFLKNYFKLRILNKDIATFVHKLDKYLMYNQNNSNALEKFLIYAKDTNNDVLVSIPIFNFDKETTPNNFCCFGNFISSTFDDETHIKSNIESIIIDGTELESPCSVCKIKDELVSGICIYKTTTYECLFNCDTPSNSTQIQEDNKTYDTTDLKTLGEFWNTPEGEKYK